ncbi:DUF805 domain-containing protein [Vibrio clamense]|uniref:DUF805 domain-containing protein n=1 Tax=Vibrio clamense TaxID=2910254 RepID=UPI003D1D4D33
MSIKELLLSFQGRIGRKVFWIWNLIYYAAIFGFAIGINILFPVYAYLLLPVFLLILMVPDLAITAKRWHDRDKSNRWLFLNVPLIVGRLMTPMAGAASATATPSAPELMATLVAFVCGIWILVECGFMKGTTGDNQYGRDPLQR